MGPVIIQGGMGVGVSGWPLARAVAMAGQLGVVSGTALDSVLVRRLQDGDEGGHLRRALRAFPMEDWASRIVDRFFRPEGRAPDEPYRLLPMYKPLASAFRQQLTVLANFVEVFLAKEGHSGQVGINYLAKIQLPTLPSLYGAMLAGVDYVLMGAGIPREIPGVLDRFSGNRSTSIRMDVKGPARTDSDLLEFDPGTHGFRSRDDLKRPKFLPIVASNSLVTMLARKSNGRVDGFVIEGPTAGGHNAPPRGKKALNHRGEPVYGSRDVVDLGRVADHGLPFWCAGGTGRPDAVEEVRSAGGAGVQVGTLFAFCHESGLSGDLKRSIIARSREGTIDVRTDDLASPTGFPFKAVDLPGSISSDEVYRSRERVCDLGYLREVVQRTDGKLVMRCPAEPAKSYLAAGGTAEEMKGRKCLCNALMANIGLGQVRPEGGAEPPFLTSGDDLGRLGEFVGNRDSYGAQDVIDYLLPNQPESTSSGRNR